MTPKIITRICIHCNKEIIKVEEPFSDYIHKDSEKFSCKPGDRNCQTVATVRTN